MSETYAFLKDHSTPLLFLDQAALKRNSQWVLSQAGGKKIRLATKSLRSTAVIHQILKSSPVFQGLMTYTLEESLWLREQGFQDILMGYPTWDMESLEKLAHAPGGITLMVDRPEHLDLLQNIAARTRSTFSICVDIDLSLDLPGVRFGVYRSWIHAEKQLLEFLMKLKDCPQLKLTGLMGYEAQIAGVIDEGSPLMRGLKEVSLKQVKKRRARMVEIIRQHGHKLELVNGGGTGSLKHTAQEPVVTEITVGSAFYAPVLFDHYTEFKLTPALFFASPVVRKPTPEIVTVLGGGYIASGELTAIKAPQVHYPPELSLLKHEGAGEVQTPLKAKGKCALGLGDFVVFRHAKAGELCERFNHIYLLEDQQLKHKVPTYRGEGKAFL